jgi:hypothetical protein
MKRSDRRLAHRFNLSIPLHIRDWKSTAPEKTVESNNVSESGVYFETDAPPHEGTEIQLRLEMPEEVTGEAASDWLCAGKVVRIQRSSSPGALVGVGVRFDYYEVWHTKGLLQSTIALHGNT